MKRTQRIFSTFSLCKLMSIYDLSEQARDGKNSKVLVLDVMAMNLLRDSHHKGVVKVCDSTRTASMFLLLHAMPVDCFPERLLFDKVMSQAPNSLRSSRRLVVVNLDIICERRRS